MIWILVAGTALAVLLIAPAVPQAAHAAKARRAEALRLREEDRKRREEEAKERQRQAQQIWHDTPDLGVYREYLRFEAQVRQPRQQAADEANRLLGQANETVSRHQSTFRDGKPPKAGYQLLAMAGLVAFAFVFILGAALDYLIFRASHPGNVLLPLGLACIAMIGITVGSILAFGARRHDLLPDSMSAYFRNMARLFGMMLAVGIAGYMVSIAPNRSYQAWETQIVADQQAVQQAANAVAPDAATARTDKANQKAAETQLAHDQASLRHAQEIDRASALALGALEIPLAEAAVIGGVLVIFRILRRRRDRAERDYVEAVRAVARADATFMADINTQLIATGNNEQAVEGGLDRLRNLGRILGTSSGGPTPGSGPVSGPSGPGLTPSGQSGSTPGPGPGLGGVGSPVPGTSPPTRATPGNPVPPVTPHSPGTVNGTPTVPSQPTGSPIIPGTVVGSQNGQGSGQATSNSPVPPTPTVTSGLAGNVARLPAAEFDETE